MTLPALRNATPVVAQYMRRADEFIAPAVQHAAPLEQSPLPLHLVLVNLDNSTSMRGKPIRQLNDAMRRFACDLNSDPTVRDSVAVAIGVFGTTRPLELLTPFVRPTEFHPPQIAATTGTPHCERVVASVTAMLAFQAHVHTNVDTRPCWVLDFTDGRSGDLEFLSDAVCASRELAAQGHVQMFYFGVGAQADMSYLQRLEQPGRRARRLAEVKDFREFFGWLYRSIRAVSVSQPGAAIRLDDFLDDNGDGFTIEV